MTVCEFCALYRSGEAGGKCGLGLKLPTGQRCSEFAPVMERFCSDVKDFVNAGQIAQMATFFGFKGQELKKIKLMAAREEMDRGAC
jgi:hypothetical protein